MKITWKYENSHLPRSFRKWGGGRVSSRQQVCICREWKMILSRRWLESAWNARKTHFRQSVFQNFLGEGTHSPTRGFRAFGARGRPAPAAPRTSTQSSRESMPVLFKSISPRTPMSISQVSLFASSFSIHLFVWIELRLATDERWRA